MKVRGQYKSGQRRIQTGSVYKIVIATVLVMALALILLLLAFLPAVNDTVVVPRTIVSIENASPNIGVGSDPSLLLVTVTYSDGFTETVTLANTTYEGLDVLTPGTQSVALSFGGFEQTLVFNVKEVDCVVTYQASLGGRIQGETVQNIPNGGNAATVIAIPETGYVFKEWEDGYPLANRKDVGVTENKNHIATFERAKFTVRFYLPDGTVSNSADEKFSYGSDASGAAPDPDTDPKMVKYGYRFVRWFPQDYTKVYQDLNIYPEYERIATDVVMTVPADVVGNAMGKTDVRDEGYYEHGKSAEITATPFPSRVFDRWVIEDYQHNWVDLKATGGMSSVSVKVGSDGQELTFESVLYDNDKYILSFTPNADIVQLNIKAIFAYTNSDITFIDYQNAKNNNVAVKVEGLKYGQPLNAYKNDLLGIDLTHGLPIPDPATGMEFQGWYRRDDESQTLLDGSETFEQPTTLIAKWDKIEYTLVYRYYNEQDEAVIWHTVKVKYQDAFSSGKGTSSINISGNQSGFPGRDPERSNYVFLGWEDAITHSRVDARTVLYAEADHLKNAEFANNHIMYLVPTWEPVSHRLYVGIEGSGSATLIINRGLTDSDGRPLERTEEINGEYVIYETEKYLLSITATEGYEIDEIARFDSAAQDSDLKGTNEALLTLVSTGDNVINIKFKVKELNLHILNGTADYSGYIAYGDIINASPEFDIKVNYNANVVLNIESYETKYPISDIKVNGTSIGDDLGEDKLVYPLTLSGVKTDGTVEIIYSVIRHAVTIEAGGGGRVLSTTPDGVEGDEAPAVSEYVRGTEVYLSIRPAQSASVRNILRGISYNGYLIDLFGNEFTDVITLYGWEINGESSGIDLIYVTGSGYYYSYGEKEYDGVRYMYCEEDVSKRERLFIVTEVYGETDYTELKEDAIAYTTVRSRLIQDLKIQSRSLKNTGVSRDMRITRLDMRLTVKKNTNLIFSFGEIDYDITADGGDNGTVTVTNEHPSYLDSGAIIAEPKAGYYVSGYSINGGDTIDVNGNIKGERYRLNLERIDKDYFVEFYFEPMTYDLVIINTDISKGAVYADGTELNNSVKFTCEYHGSETVEITTDGTVRLSSVKVNGVDRLLHYDATAYTLYIADMTGDVTVNVTVSDEFSDTPDYIFTNMSGNVSEISATRCDCSSTCRDTLLLVTADVGRKINRVALLDPVAREKREFVPDTGASNAAVEPTATTLSRSEMRILIPENTFINANIEVTVTTSLSDFTFTTSKEGDGIISEGGYSILYGEAMEVSVDADENHHLEQFFVNGEEVSFGSNAWELETDEHGYYIGGVYRFVANRAMDVKAVFAINTYKVTVDATTLNGKTVVSTSEGVSDYAPHGSFLYINMQADAGYHIAGLYINDVPVTDIGFVTDEENARTATTYIYKGVRPSEELGVTGRVNIRAEYKINRYGLNFEIVNASANFSSDTASGSFGTSYDPDPVVPNRYVGIEHGSNFSFDVMPQVSNGYYVYEISVTYTSMVLGEVTVTHSVEDNAFSPKGGTIWFNRFVDDYDGVTHDIQMIRITMKRSLYEMTMLQESEEHTGSMSVIFTHQSSAIVETVIFDADGNEYRYRAAENTFYTVSGSGTYVPTTIQLKYVAGEYKFMDDTDQVYRMRIEHGLRYTVTVRPAVGYERIAFSINGDDMASMVNPQNSYGTNIVRNVTISVAYRILIFDVNFTISVVDKTLTGTVPTDTITGYASIAIEILEGVVYDLDYNPLKTVAAGDAPLRMDLEFNRNAIRLSAYVFNYGDGGRARGIKLSYGTRIRFVMTAKFAETGYYLYSFFKDDSLVEDLEGDVEDVSSYGGEDVNIGLAVNSEINAYSSFRIRSYGVTTELVNSEGITKDGANDLYSESGTSVAWGDDAYICVSVGEGYSMVSITVKRGDETEQTLDLDPDDEEAAERIYYREPNPQTGLLRDVIIVRHVTSKITVKVGVERTEYTVRYLFNDIANLKSVTTEFNVNTNGKYPRKTVEGPVTTGNVSEINTIDNEHFFKAHHYDELAATIEPKNGYEIIATTVTVRAVKQVQYDETFVWEPVLDNSGDPIVQTLALSSTSGDTKSFTFHSATSALAAMIVEHDLEISIDITVKKYTVRTTINRINAELYSNETIVAATVKDKNNTDIILSGGTVQTAVSFTPGGQNINLEAHHHGYITYVFNAPEGYMLGTFSINGKVWNDFRNYGFSDERLIYSASKVTLGGKTCFSYQLRVLVNDDTVKGYNYISFGNIDVSFTILPISYDVKIFIRENATDYIDGNPHGDTLIDGYSGATDGRTLDVLARTSVNHFSKLSLTPQPHEGYKVTALEVRTGTATEAAYTTNYLVDSPALRKNFDIGYAYLEYVNPLEDKTTIYVYYTTEILKYKVNIQAYAYSVSGNDFVALDSVAGKVDVFVTTEGQLKPYSANTEYDYFSNVKVSATDTAAMDDGYKLYTIVEVKDGVQTDIVNDRDGIIYTQTTDLLKRVTHTFDYSVDSRGDRSFIIIYKQKTLVTVDIPNPYKYYSGQIMIGSMKYGAYVQLKAYSNGGELENISEQATMSPAGSYVYSFAYEVLVGNFISFVYTDLGGTTTAESGYTLHTVVDGADTVVTTAPYPGDPTKGLGFEVNSPVNLTIINNVRGRITFEKETKGALADSVGGIVCFNGASLEPSLGSISNSDTVVNKKVMMTIRTYEGYAFSNLYIRQIDQEASRLQKMLIFKKGNALDGTGEWMAYTSGQNMYNGIKITSATVGTDTVFTIEMRGDLELRVEFYRIYKLEYGVDYTDKEPVYGTASNAQLLNVYDNDYGEQYSALYHEQYVQYSSKFTLWAPAAPEGYKFVGWYLNGVNTYKYLASGLPESINLKRDFSLRVEDMDGLIADRNGHSYEVDTLLIVAKYQLIIDVAVVNELYYLNGDHWNSWETGAVMAGAYRYDPTENFVVAMPNDIIVSNISSKKVSEAVAANSAIANLADDDMRWNTLNSDANNATYRDKYVYSSTELFEVMYQNITNGDYINDSWADGSIDLRIRALPASVKFIYWQYFDWQTGTYKNIDYQYKDYSYGSSDNTVTGSMPAYNFALNYIFTSYESEESPGMRYAIMQKVGTEYVRRPLIIRPLLWKVVDVQLSQIAYIDALGGQFMDEEDFGAIMHPVINGSIYPDGAARFVEYGYSRMSGVFDYGTRIELRYYNSRTDSNLFGDDTIVNYDIDTKDNVQERYRFVGWQLNWEVNGTTRYRFVYLEDVANGNNSEYGYWYDLKYGFDDDPPNESLELKAVYILQHKQDLYSYNVAGSDVSYELAANRGFKAVNNSPTFNYSAADDNEVSFEFYDPITGERTLTDVCYDEELIKFEGDSGAYHSVTFFADAGFKYNINLLIKNPDWTLGDEDNRSGYDARFDSEYCVFTRSGPTLRKEIISDENKVRIYRGTAGGDPITVSGRYMLDIQYASTVKLVFENIMYTAGITLPASMASYLTQDASVNALTVWDVDNYGDDVTVPDGKVVIKMTLVNVDNFFGLFNYALNGFKNGIGFTAQKFISYRYDGNERNGENLFNPGDYSYLRYVKIDYNDNYIVGGSLIFGDPDYDVSGSSKYSVDNAGDGSGYETSFRIFNIDQLRNVGLYFHYNENSCKNVYFKLCNDIKLQDLSTTAVQRPGENTKAWTPICHYYGMDSDMGITRHFGFDGVFDGNNHTIYGMAVTADKIVPYDSPDDPMSYFIDYAALQGYGLFGCVYGGRIENLVIGNAYIQFDDVLTGLSASSSTDAEMKYIGILAARAYNADFANITFEEDPSKAIGRTTNSSNGGERSRVYMFVAAAEGVGLLAGITYDTTMTDISVKVDTPTPEEDGTIKAANCINIEVLTAGSGGGIVGIMSGTKPSGEYGSTAKGLSLGNRVVNGVGGKILINTIMYARNSGGIVGKIEGGAILENATIPATIDLYVGGLNTENVGAIAGMADRAQILNPHVYSRISNRIRTVVTKDSEGEITTIYMINQQEGIVLKAIAGNVFSDAVGNKDSGTKYGRVGGVVGFAYSSLIKSTETVTGTGNAGALGGVIAINSAVAGGIVGVAAGNNITQGFDIKAPYNSTNGVRLTIMSYRSLGCTFGGIVGANVGNAIVDDCSYTGNDADQSAIDATNYDKSYIYVFNDSSVRTAVNIPANTHDACFDIMEKGALRSNDLYVGGIVGYNTAQVYNSFVKHSRITMKYQNGTKTEARNFKIHAGGIVGHFDVSNEDGTFVGMQEVLNSYNLNSIWKRAVEDSHSRVQSCYTEGMGIAVNTFIWCDSSVDGKKTSMEVTGVVVSMSGIVGAFGSTIDQTFGGYAVNNCYAHNDYFNSQMATFGGGKPSGKDFQSGDGWKRSGTPGLYRYTAYVAGVMVASSVFGIAGTENGISESYANYCWSTQNDGERGVVKSYTRYDEFENKKEKEVSDFNARAVRYQPDNFNPNTSASAMPLRNLQRDVLSSGMYWSSHNTLTGGTVAVNDYYLDRTNLGVLFIGGFAGGCGIKNIDGVLTPIDGADGRVYRTDINTAMLMVAHDPFVSGRQPANWYYMEGGEVKRSTTISYTDFYASLISNDNKLKQYMVRGQGTTPLKDYED